MARNELEVFLTLKGSAEFKRSMRQIKRSVGDVGKSFDKLGSAVGTFTKRVTVAATAITAVVATSAKAFGDFESDFNNVVTLLDKGSFSTGTLTQGIEGLEEGVKGLRATSGESFAILNKGLFDLVSATGDAENGIDNLKQATDLALAGATNTKTAVDGLTSVLNAYGGTSADITKISQLFFTAQKGGKTTIEELANGFGLAGSSAASAGVSIEELLAAVSAATLGGIKTNSAYTSLRAILGNIIKPTKDAADEAERLGIKFDSTALRAKGFDKFLKDITSSAKFTDTSAEKLFGSLEALSTVQALLANDGKNFNAILKSLGDETQLNTNFNNALAVKSGELNQVIKRLAGSADVLRVNLGDALAPAISFLADVIKEKLDANAEQLKELFEEIGDVAEQVARDLVAFYRTGDLAVIQNKHLRDFITNMQEFGDTVNRVIARVAPAWRTFVDLLDRAAKLMGLGSGGELGMLLILGKLSGALGIVTAAIGFLLSNVRLLLSVLRPIIKLLLSPAFLALAAAFGILTVAITDSTDAVEGWGQKLIEIFDIQDGRLKDALLAWDRWALKIGNTIKKLTDFIAELFTGLFLLITGDFESFNQMTFDTLRAFNEGFANIIRGLFDRINSIVQSAIRFLVNAIRAPFQALFNYVNSLFQGIAQRVSSIVSSIKSAIASIGSGISSAAEAVGFAQGGYVSGDGSATSDSIPARLSNGEFVMRAKAVKKFGVGFFNQLNRGIKGFAQGGLVNAMGSSLSGATAGMGLVPAAVGPSTVSTGRPLTLVLPDGQRVQATTSEDTAKRLERNLRRGNTAQAGKLPGWY